MHNDLLEQLKIISQEEKAILEGNKGVEKGIYTSGKEFVIDSNRMLEKAKLIDIRTHTRFIHFPKHKHNYIEIIYMCSGSTTHIINDVSEVVLKEGDLLFLNQNASQEIKPAEFDDIAINFIILPEFFDLVFSMMGEENMLRDFVVGTLRQDKSQVDYLHFKVSDVLPIQNLVENLVWSIVNKQANRRYINQTTMGLLFLQLLNYTDKIDHNDPNQYVNNIILTVLRYIEEHYQEASLTELAIELNQSVYQLSRLIKENMGKNFKELLQTKRLNQAAYWLTTTRRSVEEIIEKIGYDNTSYFYRIFKGRYGMTPKEYREKNKKSANKDGFF